MEPIHRAALRGDVAAIDRLVAEDGRRLHAQIQGANVMVDGRHWVPQGSTALMLAACNGHDGAVARLLALGADVGLKESRGYTAAHRACYGGDHSSVLALLLDAGASINARTSYGWTPLMEAARLGYTRCVALLIDRGGDALDLNAKEEDGWTSLFWAASLGPAHIVQLLLQAGADPTIHDNNGETALDIARQYNGQESIPLLQAALVEPQRSRALFKARVLLDAPYGIDKAFTDAVKNALSRGPLQRAVLAAAPKYLRGRVERGEELPRVKVVERQGSDKEQLAACVKYALGLEGGGGVVFEGQEPTVGMLPEVLVELLEMLVPKWDPARKGRPLGEGYIEEEEEEEEEEGQEEVEAGLLW